MEPFIQAFPSLLGTVQVSLTAEPAQARIRTISLFWGLSYINVPRQCSCMVNPSLFSFTPGGGLLSHNHYRKLEKQDPEQLHHCGELQSGGGRWKEHLRDGSSPALQESLKTENKKICSKSMKELTTSTSILKTLLT